ncbi:hypothetical protein CRG98_004395 [Punica granatum]|uniref:Reverse transcriptase Ty1/copia-type domain-containing protein n=1 Tax=Punica granatum TaxID=22663 RepID=A0A2I0L3I1_PUNGR|nr:hypothetical protein CRG98_004395 [Punica granatum]
MQASNDTDGNPAPYKGTTTGQSSSVVISAEEYAQFARLLQHRAVQQASQPIVSFTQSGQPVACLTKSSLLGPWVLDSGASDHMSANGSVASDSRTRGTIGTGREFQGLYRLTAPVTSEPVERVQVSSPERPEDSTLVPVAPPTSDPPLMSSSEPDLPIAQRKGDDVVGIFQPKAYLHSQFQTKDLGALKLLGIEVAQSECGIYISQRKYVLDILEETKLLECKPVDTPMDPNVKLAL